MKTSKVFICKSYGTSSISCSKLYKHYNVIFSFSNKGIIANYNLMYFVINVRRHLRQYAQNISKVKTYKLISYNISMNYCRILLVQRYIKCLKQSRWLFCNTTYFCTP